MSDLRFMRQALWLAAQGVGRTAPNPSVGCVILNKHGRVVGAARTADGGRPHAETQALDMAGESARGGTAYVTLEPCSHFGKTPPCADALIQAGVVRVVIALGDPNPKVSGEGIRKLRDAGIAVELGCGADEARRTLEGFLSVMQRGRPFVTLKLATSVDEKIAVSRETTTRISGPEAQRVSHLLRLRHDAILVGAHTARVDNPQLTCRLSGLEKHSPVRVILESGKVDLDTLLKKLAGEGITSLLVEGGARTARSFLEAGLVDRCIWMRSPMTLGESAYPHASEFLLSRTLQQAGLEKRSEISCGKDQLLTFEQR